MSKSVSTLIKDTYEEVRRAQYTSLIERQWTESELEELAIMIANDGNSKNIIKTLIRQIPSYNEKYDWNIGSLIPHWKPILIADILEEIPHNDLINSIGLTWSLGQVKSTARSIVDFLRLAVRSAENSDAWWRAAYSLDSLGLELAVDYLKANLRDRDIYTYSYCIENFADRRATIGILLLVDSGTIPQLIVDLKNFFTNGKREEKLNAAWLVGRLRLESPELMPYMKENLESDDYEISYYTLLSLRSLSSEHFREMFENIVSTHDDVLYRNAAAYALANIANYESIPLLKKCLVSEKNKRVLGAISYAIDTILTATECELVVLKKTSDWHENGMIKDESDKWYANPEIYHIFSESQDTNGLCFEIIKDVIKDLSIVNPIDLATGTGRLAWQILDNLDFTGNLYCVDRSEQMLEYLQRRIKRQLKASSVVKTIQSPIADLNTEMIGEPSSLIISSFGFPSKVFNPDIAYKELKTISNMITDEGFLITLGWDESFNDELSKMWYKFIPDDLYADTFEDWRRKRANKILSPRNCGLSWYSRRVNVPLRFSSVMQAALVLGHLFGRSAAEWVIKKNRFSWRMNMGITVDKGSKIKELTKNM